MHNKKGIAQWNDLSLSLSLSFFLVLSPSFFVSLSPYIRQNEELYSDTRSRIRRESQLLPLSWTCEDWNRQLKNSWNITHNLGGSSRVCEDPVDSHYIL